MSLSLDRRLMTLAHPPLQGEGRTAESSPGWGDSGAAHEAPFMLRRCHPPPGPFARADLPFQGEVETAGEILNDNR
jgi:hypothetical protein